MFASTSPGSVVLARSVCDGDKGEWETLLAVGRTEVNNPNPTHGASVRFESQSELNNPNPTHVHERATSESARSSMHALTLPLECVHINTMTKTHVRMPTGISEALHAPFISA